MGYYMAGGYYQGGGFFKKLGRLARKVITNAAPIAAMVGVPGAGALAGLGKYSGILGAISGSARGGVAAAPPPATAFPGVGYGSRRMRRSRRRRRY